MFQAVIRPAAFVFVAVMLFASGHLSSITLAALVASDRGGNDVVVGILTSLPFIGMFCGSLVMPRLLARTRHVRLIALSTAGCGLTLMFLPQIESLLVWSLLRFAYGVFAAAVWLCFDTWMAHIADPSTRGRTFAIYQVVALTGISVGQVLLVTADDSIELGFGIATAAMVAAVIPICSTKLGEPDVGETARTVSLAEAWRMSPLSLLGAFCSGLCFSNFAFVLLSFGKQGVSAELLAVLGSTMMLAGIAGQLGIGYLSDRLGKRRRVMQGTLAVVIAAMAVGMLAGAQSWPVAVALGALYWGLLVTIYPISLAIGGDLISKENYQPFAAKAFLCIQSGFMVGPLVCGAIMVFMPTTGPFVFLLAVLCALLALSYSRRVMAMHTPATSEDIQPMAVIGVNPGIVDPRSDPEGGAGECDGRE